MIKKFYYSVLRIWHNHKANLYLRNAEQTNCQEETMKLMEKCSLHHNKYVSYTMQLSLVNKNVM
ncbi:hypothetical protein ACERII_13000 [Evansella sp. AB-rgal1]|uniref:hypothetical protein n=1 Tax=Evansella sp. AB-rgal1 TaxID=3242696 RepID=UPI00359CFEAF